MFEVKSSIRAVPALSSIFLPWAPVRDRSGTHAARRRIRLYEVFLSHPVCFPFLFSLQHPLFSSLFSRENFRGNRQILGSEPSLRLVWAQNQPNFRPNRQNAGNFAENPCIPGNYPATAWVFCRFPQFCLRFCPRALGLGALGVASAVISLTSRAGGLRSAPSGPDDRDRATG